MSPSARLCELLTMLMSFISFASYTFLSAYMSSMILFSLALFPLDMMSRRVLESVKIRGGTGRFKMDFDYFRIASALSVRSAIAMTSTDKTVRATCRDCMTYMRPVSLC